MAAIEINVSASSVQERCDMAAALVRNGSRVCSVVKTIGGKKRTILVVDQPEKENESRY